MLESWKAKAKNNLQTMKKSFHKIAHVLLSLLGVFWKPHQLNIVLITPMSHGICFNKSFNRSKRCQNNQAECANHHVKHMEHA